MKPTFIGIGAGRCGTTSVYYYLRQHPHVQMSPRKEAHFFSYVAAKADFEAGRAFIKDPVRTWQEYQHLFGDPRTATAAGEISPSYLWWPGAAEAIHKYCPDARLFCILRNPVDRAYSAYLGHSEKGEEKRSLTEVIQAELDTPSTYPLVATNYYVRIGFYARELQPYLELFGRQLKILFYDDLEASSTEFMRGLFEFIGVDPDFRVDTSSRFNTHGVRSLEQRFGSTGLKGFMGVVKRFLPRRLYYFAYRHYSTSLSAASRPPAMPADLRGRLQRAYAADIHELEALTGRDLSSWLKS